MEQKFKAYPFNYQNDGKVEGGTVQLRIFPDNIDHTGLTKEEVGAYTQTVSITLNELLGSGVITEKDLKIYENSHEIPLIITTNHEITAGILIPTGIQRLQKATTDSVFNIIGFDVDPDIELKMGDLIIFDKEKK